VAKPPPYSVDGARSACTAVDSAPRVRVELLVGIPEGASDECVSAGFDF
jgi:hypothetical protein